MIHIRIRTYFPMTVQICLNGHEIFARKTSKHGIEFRQVENAFHYIDPKQIKRAQRFANGIVRMDWPKMLEKHAEIVNPLLGTILKGMPHYWVADQVEFATEIMFDPPESLQPIYKQLVNHAVLRFSAEDVLTFPGRKMHPHFLGELGNDY